MNAWRTVRVGDIAAAGANSMATGPFGSSISSRYFRTSGVPVIRGGNLSIDPAVRLSDKNLVFLEPTKAEEFTRSMARPGDLVFTCWGTINQVGLVDDSAAYDTYVISNKQMKLTPDPAKADPEFLYYLFSSPPMQAEILEGSIGSSIPGFNLTRLRSLEVDLPPLKVQKKIAQALRDAEGVEENLSDRITKKQAVLHGLMHQLLSGLTRLSGFQGEWQSQPLSSLATGSKGSGLSKAALNPSGETPCVLYGELFTTYGRVIRDVVSRTDVAGGVRSSHGQVLLPGSTTTVAADLAIASALLVDGVLLGGDLNVLTLRLDRVDPVWLAYFLTSQKRQQIAEAAQGITIVHLYVKDVLALGVPLPSREEQAAIAQVLVDAEAEIDALRERLRKARNVELGIMQGLLSRGSRALVGEPAA